MLCIRARKLPWKIFGRRSAGLFQWSLAFHFFRFVCNQVPDPPNSILFFSLAARLPIYLIRPPEIFFSLFFHNNSWYRKYLMTPFVFIIFGATGDLTHRKIMPALYHLAKKGEIDTPIFFVGVGRRDITADQFAEMMAAAVHDAVGSAFDGAVW